MQFAEDVQGYLDWIGAAEDLSDDEDNANRLDVKERRKRFTHRHHTMIKSDNNSIIKCAFKMLLTVILSKTNFLLNQDSTFVVSVAGVKVLKMMMKITRTVGMNAVIALNRANISSISSVSPSEGKYLNFEVYQLVYLTIAITFAVFKLPYSFEHLFVLNLL